MASAISTLIITKDYYIEEWRVYLFKVKYNLGGTKGLKT